MAALRPGQVTATAAACTASYTQMQISTRCAEARTNERERGARGVRSRASRVVLVLYLPMPWFSGGSLSWILVAAVAWLGGDMRLRCSTGAGQVFLAGDELGRLLAVTIGRPFGCGRCGRER